MQIPIGVEVSLDNVTWYKLSDHNRQPIGINYELIEQTQRMANGTLRKYVVARKFKVTTDWQNFPTLDLDLVDYNKGAHAASWIKSFYEANYLSPVYVKLIFAQTTTPAVGTVPDSNNYVDSRNSTGANSTYYAYMTSFTYDVLKRRSYNKTAAQNTGYDYVNLTIEFREI